MLPFYSSFFTRVAAAAAIRVHHLLSKFHYLSPPLSSSHYCQSHFIYQRRTEWLYRVGTLVK